MIIIDTTRKYYYNVGTKNTSFLKVAKLLKDKNVQNFSFPLMTYDPNLIGVDPWDEVIKEDPQMQIRIAAEIESNVWYFLREVLRVPTPGGSVPFEIHLGNLAMIFCLVNNIDTAIELPRQHYKTYSAVGYYTWLQLFKARNYNMIFMHKSARDTIENLRRLKNLADPSNNCLPEWLLFMLNSKLDKDNEGEYNIASNNNLIRCVSPPGDENAAEKAGRGQTVPIAWLDEMAFIKYNDVVYGAMRPALSTAYRFAEANGTPYSMLLTTTPSSLSVPHGMFFYSKIMGLAAEFDERFYDWLFEKGLKWLKNYITENSGNDFVYIEYSYKDLGKDDQWLQAQIRSLNNDMTLVKREILLEWTYSSDESLLDEDTLTEISYYADQDVKARHLFLDKYTLYLMKNPYNLLKKNYLITLDLAGGLGRDKTAITIIDPKDESIIGFMQSNTMSAVEAVDVTIELINTFFPKAVVVPELNHTGGVYVELLKKKDGGIYEKHIFYTLKERKFEKEVIDDRTVFNPKKKSYVRKEVRVYGINTNSKTRNIMIEEILWNLIEYRKESFNNREIFKELKTLQRKSNGKIEHSAAGHDDLLFSYLIGVYALRYESTSMKRFLKVIADEYNEELVHPDDRISSLKQSARISAHSKLISNQTNKVFSQLMQAEEEIQAELTEKKLITPKSRSRVARSINAFKSIIN